MSIKEYQKLTCKFCENKFSPYDSSPSHLRRSPPLYCSRSCSSVGRRKGIIIICSNPNCKKLIEKRPCELKKYSCCDKFCSDQWRRASGICAGENNPAWRGGISYGYRGENWDKQREKALRRDEYTCQRCRLTQIRSRNLLALEVHHIIPYHLFTHYLEANSLNNLKTLCRVCHMVEEHEFIKAHPEEPSLRRIPKTTPLPKPCINCQEIFLPLTHNGKACHSCMIIKCFNCGKDHSGKEYHMKRFQRSCSQECVTKTNQPCSYSYCF